MGKTQPLLFAVIFFKTKALDIEGLLHRSLGLSPGILDFLKGVNYFLFLSSENKCSIPRITNWTFSAVTVKVKNQVLSVIL